LTSNEIEPYTTNQGSEPDGVVYSPETISGKTRCLAITGHVPIFELVHEHNLTRISWDAVSCNRLARWLRVLCRSAEVYVPLRPESLKTHPLRVCWHCGQPVGFKHRSFGCIYCEYSACLLCANCFSNFPGGRNVDTGEYIPALPRHLEHPLARRKTLFRVITRVIEAARGRCGDETTFLRGAPGVAR